MVSVIAVPDTTPLSARAAGSPPVPFSAVAAISLSMHGIYGGAIAASTDV
jgi:hypothetical protein